MMKKRITTGLLVLLVLCAGLCGAWAAQPRVLDEANLFSAAEKADLEQRIEAFRSETGMDFVIVTSQAAHAGSQQQVADELYDRGGYGMGDEKSGILYYIDMYERIPYLSTTGAMIDYMTDSRIESAHEACYENLRRGDYAGAAVRMLDTVRRYVARGIPEGQYQYDVVTGQRLTSRHKALTSGEMLMCALLGLVAAVIFVKSVEGSYRLKGSTYRYSFRENAQVKLTASVDDYLRTTTTRTRKASPPPPSGGSGGGSVGRSSVHHSSGGVRHGGGAGRKF